MKKDRTYYTVGEICSLCGVTRKTLFYYDRTGLLAPSLRSGTQAHKLYDSEALTQLKEIIEYREAGLTIAEIRILVHDENCDKHQILENALMRIIDQKDEKEKEILKLREMISQLR